MWWLRACFVGRGSTGRGRGRLLRLMPGRRGGGGLGVRDGCDGRRVRNCRLPLLTVCSHPAETWRSGAKQGQNAKPLAIVESHPSKNQGWGTRPTQKTSARRGASRVR